MLPDQTFRFEAELWLYAAARAPWHFITVPADIAGQIRFMTGSTWGFGSIRVDVRIGSRTHLGVSGLWERDDVWGSVLDLLDGNQGRWGNGASSLPASFGRL